VASPASSASSASVSVSSVSSSAAGAAAGAAHSARATAVSDDGLTGFGATTATWNAHHRTTAAAYSNVTPQNGLVVEYTVTTATSSVATAIKRAKDELPADTRQLWATQKGNCYQVELTSATVGRALDGPAIGDSSGGVLAMMNTLLPSGAPVYRPDAVTQIMLSPGAYSTPADAPDC
jgi:TPP-dependent trihydroxycyclohexane-1,2-dione (THcHDO) dehydratase